MNEVHSGIQNYHTLRDRLCEGMYRFFSNKYMVIIILQQRTTSLWCERRVVVDHVDPLQSTATLRFLVALV